MIVIKPECSLTIVGIPTYDSKMHNQLALELLNALCLKDSPKFTVVTNHSSLLARGFNELYSFALNQRPPAGAATHFLMVHSDIVPEAEFVLKCTWRWNAARRTYCRW